MSDHLEQLLANVLNTSYENFDRESVERAKHRIIDVLGCAMGGLNAYGNLALIELVKGWGGKKEASILLDGAMAPAQNVAMVNSVLARSYDFEATQARVEDVNLASHISGTTIPTALALGEALNISGKELLTAIIVGDDAACRILAASGFGFSLGWDNVGTINALGATAIAGRLLGLSLKQLHNAFGIVLNQLAGTFEAIWDGATTFKLVQGLSARNGIFSAELAKIGWTGPNDVLFGKFGYFTLYTEGCTDPEILIRGLGKNYYSEVTYKPYPGCRINHTAVDCAINFVKEYDLDFEQAEKITLKVPVLAVETFVGQPFAAREVPQIDAGFNVRFSVANALLRKNLSVEHLTEEAVRDPRITNITQKIELAELDSSEMKTSKAILKVRMNDGKEYMSSAAFPKGDPVLAPLSYKEIKQKFMHNLSFTQKISAAQGEKIISLVESFDKVAKVSDLTRQIIS